MQSSYNGIFRSNSIENQGTKEILTKFDIKRKKENIEESGSIADSYENMGKAIIRDSNNKKDKILADAYKKASKIEDEAYKKGYEKGIKNGMDKGYSAAYEEGYQKNYNKAQKEGEYIKRKADEVLKAAVEEKNNYIEENESRIKELILNAIESILKHELKDKDSLNDVVLDSMKQMKSNKTFIIKSRKKYCNEFKKYVDMWKEQIPFKGDIFIIPDESIQDGSVVVERDNGKMVFDADIAMNKIKNIFSQKD